MKVAVAGQGAFGQKHLGVIQRIPGIEVVTLTGGNQEATANVAQKFKIPHFTNSLSESLKQPGVEAVILATPTQMHVAQAVQCMNAGKHVMVEIPMADSLQGAEMLLEVQRKTGLVAMAGQTRRFSPAHLVVLNKLAAGDTLQNFVVQTLFDRRTNVNREGNLRSWTDDILWHHACHTIDLFLRATGGVLEEAKIVHGPYNEAMKTYMNMGILMQTVSGVVCTLTLSFHNRGEQGTTFRYICESGTYVCYYDKLMDGDGKLVEEFPPDSGVEGQDREFFSAIVERREPQSSITDVLPTMEALHGLEQDLLIQDSQARRRAAKRRRRGGIFD